MNHLRSFALLVTACCVLTLGGCSGMYFYDAELDALAKNAKLAFDDAKLTDLVAERRAAQAAILDRELAVVRRQFASQRNALLLSVLLEDDANTSWSRLKGRIKELRDELWIDKPAPAPAGSLSDLRGRLPDDKRDPTSGEDSIDILIKRIVTLRNKLTAKSETLIRAVDAVQVAADAAGLQIDASKLPDASVKAIITGSNDSVLTTVYTNIYLPAKSAYDADQAAFDAIKPGGVLGALMQEDAQAEALLTVGRKLVKERKGDYNNAAAALKQKIESGQPIDLGKEIASLLKTLEKIDAPLTSVPKSAKAAGAVGLDASSIEARVDVLETKLAYLHGFLESVADTEKVPPDGADFLTAVVGVLTRSGVEAINAAQAPRTSALLVEAEHLRIQLEDAKRRLANAKARQTLILDRLKLGVRQLGLLDRALDAAKAAENAAAGTSVRDVLMNNTPTATENAARSLLLLSESWVAGEIPRAEARWRDIALRHEGALDASETALAAWNNLIGVPLQQLVAVHSAGITSEQVSALINAAGFTAVSLSID